MTIVQIYILAILKKKPTTYYFICEYSDAIKLPKSYSPLPPWWAGVTD
jgi:hypothetical protein